MSTHRKLRAYQRQILYRMARRGAGEDFIRHLYTLDDFQNPKRLPPLWMQAAWWRGRMCSEPYPYEAP